MYKDEFVNLKTGDIVYLHTKGNALHGCAFEVSEIYNNEIKGFLLESFTVCDTSQKGIMRITVYEEGLEVTKPYTFWKLEARGYF